MDVISTDNPLAAKRTERNFVTQSIRLDIECGIAENVWISQESLAYELIDEWLVNNSLRSKKNAWYKPKDDGNSHTETAEHFYRRTGCQMYNFLQIDDKGKVEKKILKTYHFLEEWSLLWNLLLNNESDSLVIKQPLLVAVVNFYFHPTMIWLTFTLGLYYLGLNVYFSYLLGGRFDNPHTLNATFMTAALIVVLVSMFVVKGSVFGPSILKQRNEKSTKSSQVENADESICVDEDDVLEENPLVNTKYSYVCQFFVEMQRVYFLVIRSYLCGEKKHDYVSIKTGEKAKSFYALLEVATEYLLTVGGEFVPKRSSQLLLISTLAVVPIAFLIKFGITLSEGVYCLKHPTSDLYNEICRLQMILYLGNTINNLALYLVCCYTGITMSFLSYGADVANSLANRWVLRFLDLRRISNVDAGDPMNDKKGRNSIEEDSRGKGYRKIKLILIETPSPASHDYFGVYFYCVGRTPGLIRLNSARSAAGFTTAGTEENSFHHDVALLKVRIQRDAYERYLFAEHFMQQASVIWGPFIMGSLITCVAIFAYNYYVVLYTYGHYKHPASRALYPIVACVGSAILIFGIIDTLAYANSAMDKIIKGLTYSAEHDYHVIGSREKWRQYVTDAPMYWTIVGLAVTREWLSTFMASMLTSIIGGVILAIVTTDI